MDLVIEISISCSFCRFSLLIPVKRELQFSSLPETQALISQWYYDSMKQSRSNSPDHTLLIESNETGTVLTDAIGYNEDNGIKGRVA